MLVALMLLSVGALGTYQVFASAARTTAASSARATAQQIAASEIETIRSWSYDDVAMDYRTGGSGFFEDRALVIATPATSALPLTGQTGRLTFEGAILPITPGLCLQSQSGELRQLTCDPATAPMLRIHTRTDGLVTVSDVDGRCFGTASPALAAAVVPETCVESADQLWTILPSLGDTVQFRNRETGFCFDVSNFSSTSGTRIISWGFGTPPNGYCKPTDQATNHNFTLLATSSGPRHVLADGTISRNGVLYKIIRNVTWKPADESSKTSPSYKLVTVQVYWSDAYGSHEVRLDTGVAAAQGNG